MCVCNRHTNSSPPLRWPLSHFSYPPGFHQKTKVGGSFQLSPQTTCRYSRCPRPAKRGQVRRRFPFSPGAVSRHHPFSMAIFREIQHLASGRPSFMEAPRCAGFICTIHFWIQKTYHDALVLPEGSADLMLGREPEVLELATVTLVSFLPDWVIADTWDYLGPKTQNASWAAILPWKHWKL